MTVTIKHLYISPGDNYYGPYGDDSLEHPIAQRTSINVVAGKGIENDRYYGFDEDYHGQITFFDWAVYQQVRDEIVKDDLPPSNFRRNVLIEGIDLNTLIGKRFLLGGVEYIGSCECSPSHWMDEACGDGTHEFLRKRGGIRAGILKDGRLDCGIYDLEVLGDA